MKKLLLSLIIALGGVASVDAQEVDFGLKSGDSYFAADKFDGLDDDIVIKFYVSCPSSYIDGDGKTQTVGVGWGIGGLRNLADWGYHYDDWSAKAVSEEGAENIFTYTAGQIKTFAKTDKTGTVQSDYVDETSWGGKGVAIQLYNGASLIKVTYVPSGSRSTAALDLSNMDQNWGEGDGDTYDADTHIADYTTTGYKGFGWWIDDDRYSIYKSVVFLLEATPIKTIVKVTGTNSEDAEKSAESYPDAGATYGVVSIEGFKKINQVILQNSAAAGKVRIKAAYVSSLPVDEEIVYIKNHDWPLVTSVGYSTYVPSRKVDFTGTGASAYIVSNVTSSIVLTEVSVVPANTPVVLKAENGCYELAVSEETASDVTGNLLKASDGTVNGGADIYVLAKKTQGVGFYPTSSSITIPAGKCYVDASGLASEFLGFDFNEGGATAVERVAAEKQADGVFYNLAGQRVAQPTKGLYIVNGKKVIIK